MLENIEQKTLENGLKAICLQKKDAPIISVQLWYNTGSINEFDGVRGISHVLEHMMFRGSRNVASEEHARRINDIGGHCNAFTTEDVTAYINSVPRDHLAMVLELEAERMQNLVIDKELFETERKVLIEEYHTYMNNPVAKAFLEFRTVFYENHPYQISPLGKIEDIQSITDTQLITYYRQRYRPDNAVIVIVGDIADSTSVFRQVEDQFGSIPSNQRESASFPQQNIALMAKTKGVWMKRKVDFEVPIILTGYPTPASSSEDTLPLDILQIILSQGESCRMHRDIVRKQSLAVMAGGMNHSMKHAGMSLFFAAFTPNTSCRRVESAINAQIALVKKNGVFEQEMQKVKNVTLTSRTFELYSAENICHRIGYSETMDGDYRVWVKKLDALERLDRDMVMNVATKYLREEMQYTLYLQPKRVNPLFFLYGLARKIVPHKTK